MPAHFVCVVELSNHVVELLVRNFAVRVGICLMHQLQPYLFLYLLAVAEGVSELAYFDLPASVRVEYLENLSDVVLSDQEKSVGAVSKELRKCYFPFSQSQHNLSCTLFCHFDILNAHNVDESIDNIGLFQLSLVSLVDLHEHCHNLLLFTEGDQGVDEKDPGGLLETRLALDGLIYTL